MLSISSISLPEHPGRVLHMDIIQTRWVVLLMGGELEPAKVKARPDGHFDLYDGRHTFLAYVAAGRAQMPVELM